jgi:hypothetical protein
MMEYKFIFKFHYFDILPVEFGGDVRLPVLGDFGEFLRDVDFGHEDLDRVNGRL